LRRSVPKAIHGGVPDFRRIKLAFASACPMKDVFCHAIQRLRELYAPPPTAVAA
jgi:hypothetical protein